MYKTLPGWRRRHDLRPRTYRWPHTRKQDLRSDSQTVTIQALRRAARRARSRFGLTTDWYLAQVRLYRTFHRQPDYSYAVDPQGELRVHCRSLVTKSAHSNY